MARAAKLIIDTRHDKTPLVKKLIPTNPNLASMVLSKMLTDKYLLNEIASSPLFKYISEIRFDSTTKTACVDLKNRRISINPDFFISNIEDIRDVLFLIMHEREHVINHIKYEKAETAFRMRRHYYLLKKAGLNERFLEDVYINFSLVRLFNKEVKTCTTGKYVPLSVRFYGKRRRKKSLRDVLLSGVLTSSTKKKIRDAFGDRALKVLEDLSKKHIPLYYQFVHAFVPEDEEEDQGSFNLGQPNAGGPLSSGGGTGDASSGEGQNNYDNYDEESSSLESSSSEYDDYEDDDRSTESAGHSDRHEDNYDDYDDYEDLTSGPDDYIFVPDKGHPYASHDSSGYHYLVKVSESERDFSKLTTVFDGFLGHNFEQASDTYSYNLRSSGSAYEIFNKLVKDIKFQGKSIFMPEKLSRKDAFLLSSGMTPILWDIDYSPEDIKFVVYYDVSYSMCSYYSIVYSLKKVLAPYISKAYQFSGLLIDDEKVPEGFFDTDGSTRIRNVLTNIVNEKQKNVIIVSDFEDDVNDFDTKIVTSIKEFIDNFVLVIIGGRDPKLNKVIQCLRHLDPVEIKAN